MTIEHDENGMPVAISREYALRCQLLEFLSKTETKSKYWLISKSGVHPTTMFAPDRENDPAIADAEVEQREDGTVRIVSFFVIPRKDEAHG